MMRFCLSLLFFTVLFFNMTFAESKSVEVNDYWLSMLHQKISEDGNSVGPYMLFIRELNISLDEGLKVLKVSFSLLDNNEEVLGSVEFKEKLVRIVKVNVLTVPVYSFGKKIGPYDILDRIEVVQIYNDENFWIKREKLTF